MSVAPFKVGPDFIDPGHLARIAGKPCRNLDGWMLSRSYNVDCFRRFSAGADIAVVEGVMGLYDGYDGKTETGSTAQMAKWLNLPVLLVVNAGSMARSAAALVQGFEGFDPQTGFAGVIFNNIGSPRHLSYLKDALEGHVQMPCIGGLPRSKEIAIPERHLGLVTRQDHAISGKEINRLGRWVDENLNLETLLGNLAEIPAARSHRTPPTVTRRDRVRIGVAMDNAFCFYYPDNLELLADAGASIVPFSPLKDMRLPAGISGLYIGGGYPELHARELTKNRTLREEIRSLSRAGMPIYAECGGMMFLGRSIEDTQGRRFPMSACLPIETRMLPRLRTLGYRQVQFARDTVIGKAGVCARGHEFHYSDISAEPEGADTAYRVAARDGVDSTAEGYQVFNTLGSYIHLHFGSCPSISKVFVENCVQFASEKVIGQ